MSGLIKIGDQLCELMVPSSDNISPDEPMNLIGAPFDYVMSQFANLDRTVTEIDLVFFRGTKKELKDLCANGAGNSNSTDVDTITVTVIENKGASNQNIKILKAPVGVNIRELLVDNKINVYQSITRWTNCKGKQLCGTCIVNVTQGSMNTNRKSMDEESTLRENPDSYRLSCVSFAYGDVTVETFPPINAAQWTR
jgi:ferredoxin